jgi:hypothetical protein
VPFNLTISAKREFMVVNSNYEPIKGALAKQIWDQFSLNYTEEVEQRSNSNGMISFPKRTIKTCLLSLISGAVMKIIEFKHHANVGSTDSIGVFLHGHDWKWFYNGVGLESGVVKFGDIPKVKLSSLLLTHFVI